MKKLTKSQLEAKLRAMQVEDMKEEMMPLEEMKKRALYEYEVRQKAEKRTQKSSISHKFAVTAIIAICLIGGSFLFSVFAPTVVSSANDFMKRAGIWVNDVLRLGIVVETPIESADDGLDSSKSQTVFNSVEEASQYFNVSLLILRDGSQKYILNDPVATLGIEPFFSLKYGYRIGDDFISIVFERILSDTEIHIQSNMGTMQTAIGNLFIISQESESCYMFVDDSYLVTITTTLSQESIVPIFSNASWTIE